MLRSLLFGLADLVSPPLCVACRAQLVHRSLGFCDGCRPLLEPAPHTANDPHRDAFVYGGPVRDALHRLKYEGASEVASALARLLREPAQGFAGLIDCLTVVPLHPRRLRERGYNQSALLARPIARLLGVPFLPRLVTRLRDTEAQVGKKAHERRAQLARAFRATPRVRGKAVLVVDDVRTTGATLAAVCAALELAGARQLFTLTLAAALADDDDAL
jgi:ComF family protein